MSPDPPRTTSRRVSADAEEDPRAHAEGNNNGAVSHVFIPIMTMDSDEEDFEPMFNEDGPHELDVGGSSQGESEDNASDEENTGGTNTTSNQSEQQHRIRAQYQLLIPFPASAADHSNEEQEDHIQPDTAEETANDLTLNDVTESIVSSSESTPVETNVEVTPPPRREIHMDDEAVETIKSAMQGFALPASSIPSWAKQVEEDVWKQRLFGIQNTTGSASKSNNSES